MSKIGRKPINIQGISVEIKGQEVHYKGPKNSGIHVLPKEISAQVDGKNLKLVASNKGVSSDVNRVWGLHRALLANELSGALAEFESNMEIVGLGYKAIKADSKLVFSLGYSHKIDFDLPKKITVDIDKSGQKLTFKSVDKELLGSTCSKVKALRPPEPYKGTGIKFKSEVLFRKAGKTKSA